MLTTGTWLAAVFTPRRVALVGASDRPGSVGRLLWDNLASFPGEVVPVSQSETVGGATAYPSLREIPGEVDLAVVATPAATVPGIVAAAADRRIAVVVVLSGGFAETGPDGARLQEQALTAARAGGVRLVGPNSFGVQNSRLPLNASIAAGLPRQGGVSVVTQSGAYGMAVHTLGLEDGLGIAKVYAAGNKADITDAELLAYLRDDPDTTVIGLVLESLRDARAFFTQARLTTAAKPVIALLSGRTEAGQRAAVSHTAALATDDAVRDAALRQAGVVRVRTGLQVLDTARALASQPAPQGRRAAVITNSGGTGVELADLLADEGLDVPELSPSLQAALTALLPGYASPRNPVDVTTAWQLFPAVYPAAIDLLARSGEVDLVVPVLLQRSASREVAEAVRDAVAGLRADGVGVPVYVCWVAPRAAQAQADLLAEAGVPCFPWPERTAQAAGAAVRAGQHAGRPRPVPGPQRPLPLVPELIPETGLLAAGVARDLLAAAGVPVIETAECSTPDGAAAAAARLGFPVVAKVTHPGLTHKTDVGGVRLGLATGEEVRRAAKDLLALADGAAVLIQPQRQGVELVVGGIRDPELGPVVMAGLGGVLVETRRDIQFAVAPVDRGEAIGLLRSLRGAAVLDGVRGSAPADVSAVADVVVRIGDLLTQLPGLRELDLNPVLATSGGCIAVDWRILAGLLFGPRWEGAGKVRSRHAEDSPPAPGLRSSHLLARPQRSNAMLIGNQDVLLPTTMVGNYPNPRWYDGQAFAALPKGEFIHDSISKESLEDAIGAIVHDQEAAGLDVISDGKVYGGDSPYGTILYYYLERMSGYKLSGPPIGLPIYSTLYSPTCVGEVRREYPFHLNQLRAVRKATKRPVKVSYTGLGVIAAATTNLHYKDTREVALALAKAFNEDFRELADNGCDIIQLDEFVWPYGMGDWEIEALNAAVEGVSCQFWVHTCWGNYSGTPAYFPDHTETEFGAFVLDKRAHDAPAPERAYALFPHVLDANIQALNYEVGRTGPDDLKPLSENNWDRPFVAGVIDVKSTVTESADEVADRIRQVLEYVPAERLGLSTDCGLINLPRMIAASKLRALADGAAMVRAELQR